MKTSSNRRSKAVSAAVWSVKAEGLKPSKSTSEHLVHYASGKISAIQLRKSISRDIKKLAQSSK